ncbi:MAG: hypothetical protein WC373_06500 [Smithella sp.]|jgi:ABC-type cobalt transport system substrate-binding protein
MGNRSNQFSYSILLTSFLFFTILSALSEGSWGGSDSFAHYLISHYAFKYPSLFLDLWGKPLFTILSSPFSHFGFFGMRMFNVLIAILTAFFTMLITKQLNLKWGFSSIIAILFAPVYFILIPSGMTELLLGFVLVLAIYLFFDEKYIWSAIVVSFLPFARNEAVVMMPFFALAYFFRRSFVSLPFVFFGFFFFSLIGWHHFGNLFWIIKNNPYTGAAEIYGHGELLHFVKNSPEIFGIPFLIYFILGATFLCLNAKKRIENKNHSLYVILLVLFPALTYFVAHSYVWWTGFGGSLGLTRVMAGIVPLMAIVGASFNFDDSRKKQIIVWVLSGTMLIVPFFRYELPIKLDESTLLIKQAGNWLVQNNLESRLVYYYDPMVCYFLEKDPFDTNQVREQIANREYPEKTVTEGSIVVWDAHFGPNEGRMPLEKLLNNPNFRLLKEIRPETPFTVLNGYNYEVYVFERVKTGL